MKSSLLLSAVLAAAASTVHAGSGLLFRRQDDTCKITIPPSNGGRKVAVVIDSSGSMSTTDPSGLRRVAGKELTKQLVSSSAAGGSASADLVTVIEYVLTSVAKTCLLTSPDSFDDDAVVLYPLGDPSGADTAFDKIDSDAGTSIGDGLEKAIEELTKNGSGDTKGRSGIIVLTDGEDLTTKAPEQFRKAQSLGIRVSFGFLNPSPGSTRIEQQKAILQTGGTYATFQEAESIQPWLYLLLSNGITADDPSSSKEQPLLSGITVAKISGADPVLFSYAASQGEKLVFTIESFTQQTLDAVLSMSGGDEIAKNSTTATGPAELTYEVSGSETLLLSVAAASSVTDDVFQVSVNSSLGISGCNLNQTRPSNSTTSPALPTATAGAAKMGALGLPLAMLALGMAFL